MIAPHLGTGYRDVCRKLLHIEVVKPRSVLKSCQLREFENGASRTKPVSRSEVPATLLGKVADGTARCSDAHGTHVQIVWEFVKVPKPWPPP
jgi:hypothetical protein